MHNKTALDVLLIDSRLSSRSQIKTALSSRHAKVVAVGSTNDAIDRFCRRRYDAVLIEASGSAIDWKSLVRLMRSGNCGFKQTPVFIIADERQRALFAPLVDRSTFLLNADSADSVAEQLIVSLHERPKHSILVVDDEYLAAQAAALALGKFFKVDTAHDGPTAISKWMADRHDLIVLDLMLPGMSGHDVLKAIKLIDRQQPVLVLTSLDSPDHHRATVVEGAKDYMVKKSDLFELATKCDQLLFERDLDRLNSEMASQANSNEVIAARLHAASHSITIGQSNVAKAHLAHAIATLGAHTPGEDELATTVQ